MPIIVPIASYRYYKKREVIIENRFFLQYILPHSIVLLKSLEVLRTGDVQEILGVGRKEVYRLIADGALPLSGRAGATGFSKPLWWNGSARKKRADKKNPGCDCIRDFLGRAVSLDRQL